jgi:hypothetical protein
MENAVTRWFGPQFGRLHPLLQELHRRGGTLHGTVEVDFGRGVAGWVGRRLARRLGIPAQAGQVALQVDIRHENGELYWRRRFGAGGEMLSIFRPVGAWPEGYWIERTGFLELKLTVDVIEGGWYWRALGVRAGGLPVALWLVPGSRAFKRIENGKYFFGVRLVLPLLGDVLRYGGALEARVPAGSFPASP